MQNNYIPKKKWGQNFLIDKNISKKIISLIPNSTEKIIEIGSGKGALTNLLVKKYKTIAVEIDPQLSNLLIDKNLTMINKDALKISSTDLPYEPTVLISNLPYNISVPVILYYFENFPTISTMIVMVQKEMGERILAKKDTRIYGIPSLKINYFANGQKKIKVSKESFQPRPQVDSCVIILEKHYKYPFEKYSQFIKIIDSAFKHRRKLLSSNLSNYKLLDNSKNKRAENLSIDDYFLILNK